MGNPLVKMGRHPHGPLPLACIRSQSMPRGGVHQPGGRCLAIVKGDNVKILRGPQRLVRVAGGAALVLGLAGSALAASGAASAAVAGPARTCCTFPKQSVAVSWGANQYGQLGNGTYPEYALYTGMDTPAGVTQVAAGWDFGLALTSAGTVWAWGAGNAGQLGNGSTVSSAEPEQVPNLTGVTQIAAGAYFSLALTSDGSVWAWGEGDLGELGDNSTAGSDMPVRIAGLTGITQISAGTDFGLARRSDGTVWAWGLNSSGELGNATTTTSDVPVQVSGLSQVTQIAAGGNFAMAARTQGFVTMLTSVWTWGSNQFGALGDGETEAYRSTPGQVSGISVPSISQIAAGAEYSMVLGSDGSVWAWGADYDGQLGNAATYAAQTRPVETIGMASGITHIAAGVNHVLALRSDGTVLAWGNDQTGEIGNGTTSSDPVLPTVVTGLTNATAVSAGGDFSLAIHTVYKL
jgi:alpha-tubulin suppressor-like RCC1 family protein